MQFLTLPRTVRDALLLVSRVLLGVVLMAHGWQKFNEWTISGTAANFDKMGVPMPQVSALFAALVELVGGALILVGLVTPLAAALVALNMAGAWFFAHRGHGIFASNGGGELVGMIAAAAIALIASGAGRFSLDHLLFGRRAAVVTDERTPLAERDLVEVR